MLGLGVPVTYFSSRRGTERLESLSAERQEKCGDLSDTIHLTLGESMKREKILNVDRQGWIEGYG